MIEENSNNKLIHPISEIEENLPFNRIILIFLIAFILGIVTGPLIITAKKLFTGKQNHSSSQKINTKGKTAVGILDKKIFKDSAEGILREGGIDGEGQFHLERPGGESQNVYLTSTTVDLSQYIDKKVRVLGETFKAEKAGWLMDVGLIEIL
jgi:hypothetical protein